LVSFFYNTKKFSHKTEFTGLHLTKSLYYNFVQQEKRICASLDGQQYFDCCLQKDTLYTLNSVVKNADEE